MSVRNPHRLNRLYNIVKRGLTANPFPDAGLTFSLNDDGIFAPTGGNGTLLVPIRNSLATEPDTGAITPYNFFIYSNMIMGWTSTLTTRVKDAVGYTGIANDAWTVTDNSAASTANAYRAFTLTADYYTHSLFIKKTVGVQSAYPIMFANITGVAIAGITIDTTNGIATPWTGFTGYAGVQPTTAKVVDAGGGFWRVSYTFLATAASWSLYFAPAARSNPTSATGANEVNLTGTQVIQNAQAERNMSMSEYVETNATTNGSTRLVKGARGFARFLEDASTNLVVNSMLAGGGSAPTSWSWTGGTGTSTPVASSLFPDTIAYYQTATAERPFLQQSIAVSANTTYTITVDIESITGSVPQVHILHLLAASLPAGATVSWKQNGVVDATGSTGVTTGKLYMTLVTAAASGTVTFRVGLGCGGAVTGTLKFSRPQFEAKAYPTSYIPTPSTPSATRGSDALQLYTFGKYTLLRNLICPSNAFGNTTNNQPDPFGGNAATILVPANGSLAGFGPLLSASTVSNIVYTASVYAKAYGRDWLRLQINYVTGTKAVWFNLSNGTIGTVQSGCVASIQSLGNGWYRCIAYTAANNATGGMSFFPTTADNGAVAGDGASGCIAYGMQLEEGFAASAYQAVNYESYYSQHSQPILNIKSNLAKYSNDFSNAAWLKVNGGTGLAPAFPDGYNNQPDPFGGNNATRVVFKAGSVPSATHYSVLYQNCGSTNGCPSASSIWMRSRTGTNQVVTLMRVGSSPNIVVVTPNWERIIYAYAPANAVAYHQIGAYTGANQSIDIEIYGAQFELSPLPLPYMPTTSAAIAISEGTVISKFYMTEEMMYGSKYHLLFCHRNAGSNNVVLLFKTNAPNWFVALTSDYLGVVSQHSINGVFTSIGWHTVAMTWNASELALWADGKKLANPIANPKIPSGVASATQIGYDFGVGTRVVNSAIDNTLTFNRVLSAQEIKTIHDYLK